MNGDTTIVLARSIEESLQGDLAEFSLPSLLALLATGRRSGVLVLDDGAQVWLSAGRIYLATRGRVLLDVLQRAGAGTHDDLQALFDPSASVPVLDRILARRPELEWELRQRVHEHTVDLLFQILLDADQGFRFIHDRRHRLGDRFAGDTATVVAQAEQRLEIWRRIATRIPTTKAILGLATDLPDQATERTLSAAEWRYVALIDGRRSVADVIRESGDTPFEVCSTIFGLVDDGLVAAVDPTGSIIIPNDGPSRRQRSAGTMRFSSAVDRRA